MSEWYIGEPRQDGDWESRERVQSQQQEAGE